MHASLVANRNSGNCPWLKYQYLWNFQFTFELGLSSGGNRACYWEPSELNNIAEWGRLSEVQFSYALELKTDNLPNGVYTGEITYSIGANQDIDVGDANYTITSATLPVSIQIAHDLKVTTQAGASVLAAQLLPPNGRWNAIIGKNMLELSTVKIPLNIDTTGPFSIKQNGALNLLNPTAIVAARVMRLSTELSLNQGEITIPPGSSAIMENGKVFFKNNSTRLSLVHITPNPAGRLQASVRFYYDPQLNNSAINEALAYQIRSGNQRWSGSTSLVFDSELN
ncbi:MULTISPECIES: hypothetical protein [unclassified Undibacterium]|uniref:hypothetical protein n=1 Tax=unclassified Undibacterium TaxID=2630295 RepID=UPI002AC92CB6|nr:MULTISPECIES: hypothetical protein [unclassified Undibacterium]MEB0140863.1 hypothetical protein [Undibacterium sp. CCC2.1]MEB0173825.1 hypothetical protein [Undibacterium sp. CCC1.1]MEB0177816.1 hypothetical protein [Undibacterium sp. CCC3.4]MEB0216698.1 hypothetical protein [Undibacterium sp. 5I2]WPX44380.1 hypothetical protein RHM61_03870 [Undibacterium sp. CCC3.4]